LHRLEWTVLKRLDGLLQGDYRTLWRGAGLDLADLREYQHADDVRHIDWNVTARLQVPHVRQFTEDRESVGLVPAGPVGQRRLRLGRPDQAGPERRLRGALARLLTRHGNRVGAILYHPGAGRCRQRLVVVRPAWAAPRCCSCWPACASRRLSAAQQGRQRRVHRAR
jgi:uncharacterized protein (DUF58 family)